MTDYTAIIARKGCEATGITEELAAQMHAHLNGSTMAIVELTHDAQTNTKDGKHSVKLVITTVEPATSQRHEDLLREFQRAMYRDRIVKTNGSQLTLPDDPDQRSADDIAAEVGAAVADLPPEGVWDGDPDAPVPPADAGVESPMEVHEFTPLLADAKHCAVEGCGKTTRAAVHKTA